MKNINLFDAEVREFRERLAENGFKEEGGLFSAEAMSRFKSCKEQYLVLQSRADSFR